MILYKYMTLERFFGSFDDYLSGKVWFADWKSMNDPMEGVFDLPEHHHGFFSRTRDDFQNNLKKAKICALSYRKSLPMWAYYAGNQTGVCVGFEIDPAKLENNIKLKQVDYKPISPRFEGKSDDIIEVLSHKLVDWKHEQEWRLIVLDGEAGMRKVGEVAEIILGYRCGLARSKRFRWPDGIKVSIFILDNEWVYIEQDNSVDIAGYKGNEHDITIPSTIQGKQVVGIRNDSFWGYKKLTSVAIPANITNIEEDTFGNCTNLSTIKVNSTNRAYCSENGVLFNKVKTTLIQCPAGYSRTSYIIPSGVTRIGKGAFEGCTGITRVIIPDGVTHIERFAFCGCTSLTSVIIPGSVTEIGWQAFDFCINLVSITFEKGSKIAHKDFSDNAFPEKLGGNTLKEVYFSASEKPGTYIFESNGKWTKQTRNDKEAFSV